MFKAIALFFIPAICFCQSYSAPIVLPVASTATTLTIKPTYVTVVPTVGNPVAGVIYRATVYPTPTLDPVHEDIRIIQKVGGDIVVLRGQNGTTAHDLFAGQYWNVYSNYLTPVATFTPTNTPTVTDTPTKTNTPTNTPTETFTPTNTPSPTFTPTFTSTPIGRGTVILTIAGGTPTPVYVSNPGTTTSSIWMLVPKGDKDAVFNLGSFDYNPVSGGATITGTKAVTLGWTVF